jgi:hypothetical protein
MEVDMKIHELGSLMTDLEILEGIDYNAEIDELGLIHINEHEESMDIDDAIDFIRKKIESFAVSDDSFEIKELNFND